MKDWIFYICVIINVTGLRGKFKQTLFGNMSRLDDKLGTFPTTQPVPYDLKKLHKGISPFVTKSDGPLSKKKLSTTGMGNLNFQDVPGIVLQILLIVGPDESILTGKLILSLTRSSGIVEEVSVRQSVLESGYKLLSHFFNLRRTNFTPKQVSDLGTLSRSVHYDMYRLFWCKQVILGVRSNYGGKRCLYFLGCLLTP